MHHPRIHWLADPTVLAPILLLIVLYARRFMEVRREAGAREGRGAALREAGARAGRGAALGEAGAREERGGALGEAGAREERGGALGEAGEREERGGALGEAGAREGQGVGRSGGPRGATPLHALAFAGGIVALLAALVTPIDGLGEEYLFSAHMLQHVLLGDIAPLLLLLSLSRVMLRPVTRRLMGLERALGPFASPLTAIAVWLGTMYLWHIPALYDAALEHPLVHALEHFSFFAAGLALWWPLVQPIPMRRSLTGLQPLGYIAAAKGGLAALGLVLAWSSTAFYPFYEDVPRIWGLTAVEDQNVAGVIMMVEQSMTLVLVMVWVFVRMLTRSEEDELRRERLEEAQVPASNVDVISTGP